MDLLPNDPTRQDKKVMNDPSNDLILRYTVLSLFVGMILIGLLFYAILK